METIDEEFLGDTLGFIDQANKEKKPFFVWFNSTRMHIWTYLKRNPRAKPVSASIPTAWSSTTVKSAIAQEARRSRDRQQHDRRLFHRQWRGDHELPDGGTTIFRSEKNTNWEGAYRVPAMVRWPGLCGPAR